MNKQFTASEVRNEASNHWRLSDGPQQTLAGKMLHAYADRLEADEGAVPVASISIHGTPDGHTIPNVSMNQRLPVGYYEVFLRSGPSDAERLADAQNGEWPTDANVEAAVSAFHRNDHLPDFDAMKLALLAAHSAQAQPPAASVTDTLAVFEVVSGVEGPCLTISRKADGKPRHEYRLAGPKPWGGGTTTHSFKVHTRELREQIDAIEAALAAQENPND